MVFYLYWNCLSLALEFGFSAGTPPPIAYSLGMLFHFSLRAYYRSVESLRVPIEEADL